MKSSVALFFACLLCLSITPLQAATITGMAVDLDGNPIMSGLTVTVQSAQGVALNQLPPVINNATGTYSITVDPALLMATGAVTVNLTVSGGGRLTAQLNNLAGIRDQTIDVVLPEAPTIPYCCTPCYCQPKGFHRRCCK